MHPLEVVGGRFEIEALSASGGMGQVYRARDRASGESVALKVLPAKESSDRALRFGHEARVLEGLAHPAIVRYIARGLTAQGEPYIAMEWLDGQDLASRLERARLSVRESVIIGQRIAEALGAAHACGVIHRDIKPENIFLRSGRIDDATLIDFGIARGDADVARARTRTGILLGTPGYMAPEQARGEPLDQRVDVFALGCVLFECLTGRPAFFAMHVVAVLAKVLLEEVPPLRDLCPRAPAALAQLCARMLCKQRDARPPDGAAVAAELSALAEDDLSEEVPSLPSADATQRIERTLGLRADRPSAAPPAPTSLTAVERRLVSVLVAAPEGADSAASGPTLEIDQAAEASASLAEALVACGARVQRLRDGSLLGTIVSDALMRVGQDGVATPTDQAAQAAHIALAVRAALPGSIIALATGRGVVGELLPIGNVIDRAAQLVREPRSSGAIRLDRVTAQLLDARFDVEEVDGQHWLTGERPALFRTRTLLGRAMPCVGREHELSALVSQFEGFAAEPAAGAVLITAAAGLGKSRLAREVILAMGKRVPGVAIWLGHAAPMSKGSALAPIAEALRSALPADARKIRESIGRAFTDRITAETAERPVLLVLEDLHWADQATVDLVDTVLRDLNDRPFMVLGLARPEVHERFPDLWTRRGVQEICLSTLSKRASERLVREGLGAAVDDATVARIGERAAGNALYLEELIRAVAEGHGDALPETVVAMVGSRLLGFDAETRRHLRAASIFGQVFWRGAIAELSGADSVEVRRVLDDLIRREVIVRQGEPRFAGQEEFMFCNTLLREAAYGALTDEDRALGHRLAAAWLERAGEADAQLLAEHCEKGGLTDQAAGFRRKAAEQAPSSAAPAAVDD